MELQLIQSKICEVRGFKVILDRDLATMYETTTSNLNKSVKRNINRFPEDFMFQLTKEEFSSIFQNGTSSWGGIRKLPYAFTEHGISMMAGMLNSSKAIEVNIQIVRAFVAMRQYLIEHKDTLKELDVLKNQIRFIQDDIEGLNKDHESYEQQFDDIYLVLTELAAKNKERRNRPPIGYIK